MGCLQCKRGRVKFTKLYPRTSYFLHSIYYSKETDGSHDTIYIYTYVQNDSYDTNDRPQVDLKVIPQDIIPDTNHRCTITRTDSYSSVTDLNPQDESPSPPQSLDNETIPDQDQQLIQFVGTPIDIFNLLSGTNITKANEYCCREVDWTEKHLQVELGLNILATCKNVDCPFYLDGVICPRGLFPARKGHCSFDREIHKVACPICKQKIAPDLSFGIGFYGCKFELEFMLADGTEHLIPFEAVGNTFVMTKCSSYSSGPFLYLEIRIRS